MRTRHQTIAHWHMRYPEAPHTVLHNMQHVYQLRVDNVDTLSKLRGEKLPTEIAELDAALDDLGRAS